MRPHYVVALVGAIGVGLAGWVTLGQAGPRDVPPRPAPPDPIPGERPAPSPRPAPKAAPPVERPFDDPLPMTGRPAAQDSPPATRPVRVLDPVDLPDLPGVPKPAPLTPRVNRDPAAVKPTVFIPYPDPVVPDNKAEPKSDDGPVLLPKVINQGQPSAPEEPRILPRTEARPAPKEERLKPVTITPQPSVIASDPPPEVAANPAAGGPAAHQEPAVRLEWHGPTTVQVGTPVEYTLTARNTSAIPLHKVILQVKVPAGAKVLGTEPKADGTSAVLLWDQGVFQPGDEKTMKMTFLSATKGEFLCQAWVTFTGSAALQAQVREPKLVVAAAAPERVAVGEQTALVLTVSNPGDHPAEEVKVAVSLPDGLESPRGPKVTLELNTLTAGETREVKVPCLARTAGPQACEVSVEGGGGLKANTVATLHVVQAKLNLQVAGPKLRYLDRKAAYTVKLANAGDAPAAGVKVTEMVPAGFQFVSADADGKFDPDARVITWSVGEIGPGQEKELAFELAATGTGEFVHKVQASGDRGLRAEQSVPTRVEGVSALAMEVIDTDDPVEVATETTYEVRLSNTGSKDETDVRMVCTIPPQMKFKAATGPGKFEVIGPDVVFDVVKRLPARTEVTFKVTVTAAVKGDARFKATLTAGGLSEPVIMQESTRVYAD